MTRPSAPSDPCAAGEAGESGAAGEVGAAGAAGAAGESDAAGAVGRRERVPATRRAIRGWALYDFANSAYTTLVVTFIYGVFFREVIVDEGTRGTVLWGDAVTIVGVVVALASPVLGALADRRGYRRPFLATSTVVTVVLVALLALPGPGEVALAFTLFVLSDIAYELCGVFYNSYLPELAPPDRIGRISGMGWALGYLGGLLAMIVALVGFVRPEEPWFGIPTEGGVNVRATMVLVALWFAVFSVPFFVWVDERRAPPPPDHQPLVRGTFRRLKNTFAEIRKYRQIFRLLAARLIYNDGLVTIFAFGPLYAAGTFGFTLEEVMVWGLALNVTAGLGAFAMGYLDDRLGGKWTILVSLAGLSLGGLAAVLVQTKAALWAVGLWVGIWVGPNQAASRSLLGRFVPERMETEFYGFFAFSGKAIAFLGPFLLARVTGFFDSERAGMSTILLFFVVGGALLLTVDEGEGIRQARRVGPPPP